MTILGIVLMFLGLLLIPLGLPGLWIMVGVAALGAIFKMIGVVTLAAVVVVVVVAEFLEYVVVKRLNTRYGGSRNAFWGAIAGGMIGVFVGSPVPIVGSMIAAFVGSFVGAAVVTWAETKSLGSARRVGWGVTLGRALAVVVKVFAGLVVLILTIASLLL